MTKADAELLAHAPLREGDVLVELDGQRLDLARLADELGDYGPGLSPGWRSDRE